MIRCLIALTSLFSAAAVTAPAWTWVDEQGQRHYSDRPVEGATRIELGRVQTFSSAEASGSTTQRSPGQSSPEPSAAASEAAAPEATEYTVLAISSPASQETLFNIEGNLEVDIVVYPPLQAGHRFDVILDGDRLRLSASSRRFTIPEVWRGEHTLQALVIDENGTELTQSSPVTFNVRQTSQLQPQPQRAQPPTPRPIPLPTRAN